MTIASKPLRIFATVALGAALLGVVPEASAQCYGGRGYYPGSRLYRPAPHRFYSRPKESIRPGLSYFSYRYPHLRYFNDKRDYPHTIDGSMGRPREPIGPRGHLRVAPGYSPFSRNHDIQMHGLDMFLGRDSFLREEDVRREVPGEFLPPRVNAAPSVPPQMVQEPAEPPAVAQRPSRPEERAAPAPRRIEDPRRGMRHIPATPRVRSLSKPVPVTSDEKKAWNLLGSGSHEQAQYAFASLALANPTHARPKIGFALSLAGQDDHGDAVWQMRRAFRVDPVTLGDMKPSDRLRARLQAMLDAVEDSDSMSSRDALFMQAALHYILGDRDEAQHAIAAAVRQGDRDLSTLRLIKVITGDVPSIMPEMNDQPRRHRRRDLEV